MAGFCCCPCGEELEEYAHGNSLYRHCVCFRFLFHQIFNGYGVMFHRLESRPMSTPIPVATSSPSTLVGTTSPDSSSEDTHYDADPRYSRLQRDGLVSRRDKSMTHFQEDSQPVRRNFSGSSTELTSFGKKWNGVDSEEEDCTTGQSDSLEKAPTVEVSHGLASEDEDVCPTCLDEYTSENPKITTRCSHHFHLGCIYEWLERSESCPICGKEMEFCESP